MLVWSVTRKLRLCNGVRNLSRALLQFKTSVATAALRSNNCVRYVWERSVPERATNVFLGDVFCIYDFDIGNIMTRIAT